MKNGFVHTCVIAYETKTREEMATVSRCLHVTFNIVKRVYSMSPCVIQREKLEEKSISVHKYNLMNSRLGPLVAF